jgi:hypothetical protein
LHMAVRRRSHLGRARLYSTTSPTNAHAEIPGGLLGSVD